MSIQVLQSREELRQARAALIDRGASRLTPVSLAIAHRLGLTQRPPIGSFVKSWDVLKTLDLLEAEIGRDEPVLDVGAWSSEILPVLHGLGYRRLTGIDLDPRLPRMPYADSISYVVGNFYDQSSLGSTQFRAITAISVIEHGLDLPELVRRLATLLMPGGFFVATTDYWSEPIDTSSLRPFGLPWTIFDRSSLQSLVEMAKEVGLQPIGNLAFDTKEHPLHWMGKRYTAAWIALRRRA